MNRSSDDDSRADDQPATSEVERRARQVACEQLCKVPERMLEGLVGADDDEMIAWIVERAWEACGMEYVFIGELTGENLDHVQTLSVRASSGRLDNFEYELHGTPCSDVLDTSTCVFPADVVTAYPDDLLLAQMGIQSYVGAPLSDDTGRPLGLIVGLHTEPIDRDTSAFASATLDLWSKRASSLLAHRRQTAELRSVLQINAHNGEEALWGITEALTRALNVTAGFVATPGRRGLQTRTFMHDGSRRPPVRFRANAAAFGDEPSERVMLTCGAKREFPRDPVVRQVGAEGYLAAPLFDEQGELLGILGVAHPRPFVGSIERSAVFEACLGRVGLELMRIRTDEERLRAERRMLAAQRRESLGVLAGGIAHDFNNLLVSILGNAELIAADIEDGPERECAEDVVRGAQRAADLCRQMLAYAGQGSYIKKPINLAPVVGEVGELLRNSIPPKVELRIDVGDEPLEMFADSAQIQQVVMNLITNAGDAIGEKTGHIEVSTRLVQISGEELDDAVVGTGLGTGTYARLRVTDTGIGMSAEVQRRIFEPFFTTKARGNGLGLAAVLGIIQEHSGALLLRSTPGEGTTFDVVLPLSKGEEVLDGQPASGIEHQAQSRGRLLVVDPDATVRRSVKRMLGHQGFAVLTAANGAEALEIVRRDDGDLRAIIIDLNLPAESGPDTIRALNAMTDIPVLVSSGYGEKVIRNKTGDLTVAGLLPKPYSLEELTSMLAGTLSASMN